MERLRKNRYHLWKVMVEVREDPAVEEWRQAPRGSLGWRKATQHETARWCSRSQ
jgi:starvation-inducible outer membrane lipoprotein